ncbi:hypothetical protein F4811DRAFT_545709, partial [Daldinia bambusicola]
MVAIFLFSVDLLLVLTTLTSLSLSLHYLSLLLPSVQYYVISTCRWISVKFRNIVHLDVNVLGIIIRTYTHVLIAMPVWACNMRTYLPTYLCVYVPKVCISQKDKETLETRKGEAELRIPARPESRRV